VADVEREGDHQDDRHGDDEQARVRQRDLEAAHLELPDARDQGRHGLVARALADGHPVLQEDGHADGRDERHQPWTTPHRSVGDALDGKPVDDGG
jgi:hypothetical protein